MCVCVCVCVCVRTYGLTVYMHCTCLHVCGHICEAVHVHTCVCMWKPEIDAVSLPLSLTVFLLRLGLLLNPELKSAS